MPFFDANKMGIHIDYDDNMSLVGGSLRGVVNIFVRETVTLCGASLRYRIIEGCALAGGNNGTSPDCYTIEYVLFGARSTKKAPPVRVKPGHYSYPFAIPIPAYAPPTQRFGGNGDPSLLNLFSKDIAPSGGPCGPAVRIEHVVEVVVYVAMSWKDKHQSKNAPSVVTCTTPALLTATNNGMEGHIRNGYSIVLPGKGFLSKLFNNGPKKSKEQADCDLFVYNTTVSLADSPFLHFAIRGKTNCPFQVQLVRVVKYTYPEIATSSSTSGGSSQTANGAEASALARGNGQNSVVVPAARPTLIDEQVISSTTMPPLDSPSMGVKGRLLISPISQEHSVSFTSRCVSVHYYVTMSLQYLENKSSSSIPPELRMRIPINIYHGTFEQAYVQEYEDPSTPHYARNAPAEGYHGAPVTGSVMGYDAPPQGENAQFRPAAPVTDNGVTSTQWSNPSLEMVIARPNNHQLHNHNHNHNTNGRSASNRGGGVNNNNNSGAASSRNLTASAANSSAALLQPQQQKSSAGSGFVAAAASSNGIAGGDNDEDAAFDPLVMSRIPVSTIANRRGVGNNNNNTSTNSSSPSPIDSVHTRNGGNNNQQQQEQQRGGGDNYDADHFRDLTPPADRLSAHRRMYDNVAPSWVRKEMEPPSEPIADIPIAAASSSNNSSAEPGNNSQSGDSSNDNSVTTVTLM